MPVTVDPADEPSRGLQGLRGTIAKELADPWGKVNAYVGYLILAITVLATANYFAGSVFGEVRFPGIELKVPESDWKDLVLVILFFLGSLLYWSFCLKSFAQIKPTVVTEARHRRRRG